METKEADVQLKHRPANTQANTPAHIPAPGGGDAEVLDAWLAKGYAHGFETPIDYGPRVPPGLNTNIIRTISQKKNEPSWLLDWRLKAFELWQTMHEPRWSTLQYPAVDYQKLSYYAAPKNTEKKLDSLDQVDPAILRTYEKLGIPLEEQKWLAGVAVDAVFDSVSVGTTFQKELEAVGVIFCSISEAVQKYPDLVRKYLGRVVPARDNFFACLNAAVFTDGSFVYIPEGVRCPMELSTYFRINARNTGQFERTLIIADQGSFVSYLEGCTAPQRDENQLHAAVVELVALAQAEIKYATVQNWYPGDQNGTGGVYNFVTKRGSCAGYRSKITWTQVETGSAVTWKYPSCILAGEESQGEFYSVAITNHHQQADTGTKMIHLGKNSRSRIISKGISAGVARQTYRGHVQIMPGTGSVRNYTQCDSLLIGERCRAVTLPYIESRNPQARLEHEATTSRVSAEQLFFCQQRGLDEEQALGLIVNGFCQTVLQKLPMEFAVEARKLVGLSLEGSVG